MKYITGQWPCLHDQLCLCSGRHIHQSFVASVSLQSGLLQQLLQDAARTALPLQHWLESCLQPVSRLCCCQLPYCIPLILSHGLCSKRPIHFYISIRSPSTIWLARVLLHKFVAVDDTTISRQSQSVKQLLRASSQAPIAVACMYNPCQPSFATGAACCSGAAVSSAAPVACSSA